MSSALQNRIRQWINGVEVVQATRVAISQPKPTYKKFGAAGLIGIGRGQAGCDITITFAQPDDKAQFEAFALAQDGPGGFTYVYTKGSSRFMVMPCVAGDAEMSNEYESGVIDVTLKLTGAPAVQVS